MRLWHESLLKKLPQKQICGQWRECIALLGKGWGRKHSVVNYVFENPEWKLVVFATRVYKEMVKRGYHPNSNAIGKALNKRHSVTDTIQIMFDSDDWDLEHKNDFVYDEHDDEYLQECVENLFNKGIVIRIEELGSE